MSYGVKLHVWGDYACFTRPEMKVERVSYDVMTPSAARGILEAVALETRNPLGDRPSAHSQTRTVREYPQERGRQQDFGAQCQNGDGGK